MLPGFTEIIGISWNNLASIGNLRENDGRLRIDTLGLAH